MFCIDIVCHGVASSKMLSEQLKKITNDKINSISFRNGLEFRLKIDTDNKTYEKNGYDVPYYSLYLNFASLRESCYSCQYAQIRRVGDITIGDFVDEKEGVSLVICNSNKGEMIFSKLQENIVYKEKNICLLSSNTALFKPSHRSENSKKFALLYEKYGLIKAYNKSFRKLKIKRKIRGILGDRLYMKLKGISVFQKNEKKA